MSPCWNGITMDLTWVSVRENRRVNEIQIVYFGLALQSVLRLLTSIIASKSNSVKCSGSCGDAGSTALWSGNQTWQREISMLNGGKKEHPSEDQSTKPGNYFRLPDGICGETISWTLVTNAWSGCETQFANDTWRQNRVQASCWICLLDTKQQASWTLRINYSLSFRGMHCISQDLRLEWRTSFSTRKLLQSDWSKSEWTTQRQKSSCLV